MSWQPIETAPKDGTLFLAWEPCFNTDLQTGWYGIVSWEITADADSWDSWVDFGSGAKVPEITHWQPLPEAPL